MSQTRTPLLSARQLLKHYGATRALDGADITLHPGEVVALMGANGAGKSTLVKLLAGAEQPGAGSLHWQGRPLQLASPADAVAAGIVTVHQQTALLGVPGLSVAENLLLGRLCCGRSAWHQAPAALRAEAAQVAASVAPELPLDADFADLNPAQRQLLALARALYERASLVILDEPTASLSAREAERLFALLAQLKAAGMAILYVSHRLADLRRIADRAVVLRNGRVAGEFAAPLNLDAAVACMVGGSLPQLQPRPGLPGTPRLQVDGLRLRPGAQPLALQLQPGEVVAITGNLGSGKTHLLHTLFGLLPANGGDIRLDGKPWQPRHPRHAIAHGVYLAAEDRWKSSFLPADTLGASLADLMALPHLARLFPGGRVRQQELDARARDWIARLGIRCHSERDTPDQLSGGNQQKVVLARWQQFAPRVLLLDEPFQGVDVGARHDLVAAIRAMPDSAVLLATSDLEEALAVADRILVMREHTLHAVPVGQADALQYITSLEQAVAANLEETPS